MGHKCTNHEILMAESNVGKGLDRRDPFAFQRGRAIGGVADAGAVLGPG